jgi:hypothetical protein
VPRVEVRPWVLTDVANTLKSRTTLGRVLFDLNNHLPSNLALYQPRRIPGSPRCFSYARIYVNAGTLQGFSFVVQDADPAVLDVIWVIPTA